MGWCGSGMRWAEIQLDLIYQFCKFHPAEFILRCSNEYRYLQSARYGRSFEVSALRWSATICRPFLICGLRPTLRGDYFSVSLPLPAADFFFILLLQSDYSSCGTFLT